MLAEIPMSDDILARAQQEAAWNRLQEAYARSVAAILDCGANPSVPGWLDRATSQFAARAAEIGRGVAADGVIKRLLPTAERTTKGEQPHMVEIKQVEIRKVGTDVLQTIHLKKAELQAREPALSDHDALSRVFQAEPELYRNYCRAEASGIYLPPIEKRAEAPIPSGATATLIMLAQSKIAKGMPILQAYAEVARECPEQYRQYRLQSLGRLAS